MSKHKAGETRNEEGVQVNDEVQTQAESLHDAVDRELEQYRARLDQLNSTEEEQYVPMEEELGTSKPSKSQLVRLMYDQGSTVASIARSLRLNYSFVYGVVQKHCEKRGVSMRREVRLSKSDEIRMRYDQGQTIGQIAKEMNTNYSYVWTIVDAHRKKQAKEALEELAAADGAN